MSVYKRVYKCANLPILAASLLLTACSTDEPVATAGPEIADSAPASISLKTLSTQPWLVSGGDVLVEGDIAPGAPVVQTRLQTPGDGVKVEVR